MYYVLENVNNHIGHTAVWRPGNSSKVIQRAKGQSCSKDSDLLILDPHITKVSQIHLKV